MHSENCGQNQSIKEAIFNFCGQITDLADGATDVLWESRRTES
jgi:hypothetical protein